MNKEEKLELEHKLRNEFVSISGLCKRIQKKVLECEKTLDSYLNDGLTVKSKKGIIE